MANDGKKGTSNQKTRIIQHSLFSVFTKFHNVIYIFYIHLLFTLRNSVCDLFLWTVWTPHGSTNLHPYDHCYVSVLGISPTQVLYTRHIQTGLECAVTMHSMHTCDTTCSKVWTHLCACMHACMHGVLYLCYYKNIRWGVCCYNGLYLLKMHGDKVFHRVRKFYIV